MTEPPAGYHADPHHLVSQCVICTPDPRLDVSGEPSTEAGRRLFRSIDLPDTDSAIVTRDDVVAIEAEARATPTTLGVDVPERIPGWLAEEQGGDYYPADEIDSILAYFLEKEE